VKPTPLFDQQECKSTAAAIPEILPFKRLRDQSLDFKDIPASSGVYGIHPYPAMFHFLVVRRLIRDFSEEGQWVFDPFMGSGVAAVESNIGKRNFIGFDINPLAFLIAKVRSTPLHQSGLIASLDIIDREYQKTHPRPVEFHNIEYWFHDPIIKALSRLREAINSRERGKYKDFFDVAFSETVRRVSRTEYNEFKLLRRKDGNQNSSVLKTFKNVSLRNIGLLTEFYKTYPRNKTEIFLEKRNVLEADSPLDESIDLVVTSPPYGDSRTTVAYGQFSRLSLRWLGFEESVDRTSLGNSPKLIAFDLPSPLLYECLQRIGEKDEKRAREVFSFYRDLFDCIQVIEKKVKANGYVCFVVGNRTVKGEELPTDKISADFFEYSGFEHRETLVREISSKRMPAENAPSNIRGEKGLTMRYEYIVILKKRG
jgi:site-specific DNA-methyltransferase (cytosine-N4-specific)